MILSIDPGQSIGWALWDQFGDNGSPQLLSSGKLGSKAGPDIRARMGKGEEIDDDERWLINSESLLTQFVLGLGALNLKSEEGITDVYIEQPLFIGGAVGRSIASKGDLVKLTLVAGAIWGIVRADHIEADVHWVPVVDWKGQLKKETVIKRLKIVCGNEGIGYDNVKTDHEWDAIGIGLYAQGFFERGIPTERGDE